MKVLQWTVLASGLLLLPAVSRQPSSAAAPPRPNVVVIMTDDQTVADLRALPKTRALLADHGTTFANSFVAYALCCPSRATYLTGQYAHNHGVMGNKPPNGGYARLDHANTLPVWLQAAGYDTAHVGKYMNGYGLRSPTEVPPGWSRWFALVDPATYQMYGYSVNDDGVLVDYGDRAADYQTDVLAREAERFVRAREGLPQPFFLSVAPLAPHLERSDEAGKGTPPRPAPRHAGRFAAEPLPAKPSFNEADLGDKPPNVRKLPPLSSARVAAITATHRARLASLLAVDDLVERLVDALAETGQLDDTVIVFTSDNGFLLGEHRVPDGKYLPYEESIRVPLIIRGGRFPAGATAAQPVSNIDLAPTIVALTGAVPRRTMDGQSLLPLALDPKKGTDRALLVEGVKVNSGRPTFQAVRDARWLYVEYAGGAREMYDLQTDPYQVRSQPDAAAFLKARANLARRLARLRKCAGAGCR